MKNAKRNLVVILILLLATFVALTACDFTVIEDIAYCEITLSGETFEYTGEAITPEVTVKYGGATILQQDVDYTVEYASNIEVGTGYIRVNGIGKFTGSVVKEFKISSPKKKYLLFHFYAPDAEFVSGKATQSVESVDDIVVPIVEKKGYNFLYWTCDGKEVDFDNKDSLPNETSQFDAVFELIIYTIEYNLNGGVNHDLNKEEFNVENVFELQDATRFDMKFVGWYLDEDFNEKLTSLSGVTRNLVLYAKYVDFDYQTTLSYVLPDGVDSDGYEEQTLYPGTELTRPANILSQDGSEKLVWYIDEDMTIRFNLRYMPDSDLTLYARWEDTVYAGFLDRGWYKLSDIDSIDSYEDMLAFVEFVLFHNITDKTRTVNVTYVSGKENIEAEISKAWKERTFPSMLTINYKPYNNSCSIYMPMSVSAQATLSATDKKDFYPQIGDVFNNYKSNRSSTYDAFAINYVENEYMCETTDQLFYVLSHGYRPLPANKSLAYKAYEQFKDILRGICDDRMSDVQKARAIFDWLVLNVYYDNRVASGNLPQSDNYKYDAFYIEGVLNGAAVCDGLSKAYAAMCAIEGIDCVRVTGKLKDAKEGEAGHAWNKIHLMGEWYLTDATWGNRVIRIDGKYYEYLNGEYFLFTDEQRSDVDNYNSEQYSQYVADGQFSYYSNFQMQLEISKKNRTFDLCLDGDEEQGFSATEELSYVFEYLDKSGAKLDGKAFCIILGEDMTLDIISNAFQKYKSRVIGSFKIPRLEIDRYLADTEDLVDPDSKVYRKGSIITIILSLPTSASTSQIAA